MYGSPTSQPTPPAPLWRRVAAYAAVFAAGAGIHWQAQETPPRYVIVHGNTGIYRLDLVTGNCWVRLSPETPSQWVAYEGARVVPDTGD